MESKRDDGVGLACSGAAVPVVLASIESAGLRLCWVVASFRDAVSALVKSDLPAVVIVEMAQDPDFWAFVQDGCARLDRPALVVFGRATATEAFRLATLGTDSYFESPEQVVLAGVRGRFGNPAAALARKARQLVREMGVTDAQRLVRAEMFQEALRQTGGNRHATARLLRVSRRYVLKMLNELE